MNSTIANAANRLIERLRDEQQAEREKVFAWGAERGREWAEHDAKEIELRALAEYEREVEDDWGSLATFILDVDMPGELDHAAETLKIIGLANYDAEAEARAFFGDFASNPSYLAGWCDGALDAWRTAKQAGL